MNEKILGRNNYEIPCVNNVTEDEKIVVIISHGLGSSKGSPTVLALMEKMESCGIGTFAYDFPGHGESPVDGRKFLIKNCLSDLADAEDHVRLLAPKAEIVYFSSSFGAYINILYLSQRKNTGRKSFLRSAAVDMPGIFKSRETTELIEQLKKNGCFVINEDSERPLIITKEFCDELAENNVFEKYIPKTLSIAMVHGDLDETAPVEDAKKFSGKNNFELIVVKDGYHRLMGPGQMNFVLEKAAEFFKGVAL